MTLFAPTVVCEAELFVPCQLWTVNQERQTQHFYARGRLVAAARQASALLARSMPAFVRPVEIVCTPVGKNLRQDVGACLPAAKAAIDGLRDAGILVNDDPRFVKRLSFECPERGDTMGIRLVVREFGP